MFNNKKKKEVHKSISYKVDEYDVKALDRLKEFTNGIACLLGVQVSFRVSKKLGFALDRKGNEISISRKLVNRYKAKGTHAVELMIVHELMHIRFNDDRAIDIVKKCSNEANVIRFASVLVDIRADVAGYRLLKNIYEKIGEDTLNEFNLINEDNSDYLKSFKNGRLPVKERTGIMYYKGFSRRLCRNLYKHYVELGIELDENIAEELICDVSKKNIRNKAASQLDMFGIMYLKDF